MSTALRWLFVVTLMALLAYVAWPWLKNAMYLGELLAEEPPRTLQMPVKGVTVRAVRDTFGAPRPGDRAHQGVDIFAPRGTSVVSTTRGVAFPLLMDKPAVRAERLPRKDASAADRSAE